MKKCFALFLIACMLNMLLPGMGFASVDFDINAFDEEVFDVSIDEMDDTGEIAVKDSGAAFIGSGDKSEDGIIYGSFDIRIIENFPPCIRLTLMLISNKNADITKQIFKVGDRRYTFTADCDSDVDDGTIYEMCTIVFTDESVAFVKDIIDNDGKVKFRLDGSKRQVDGTFTMPIEGLKKLYDAYVASGALNNDFIVLKTIYPVAIK